MNGTIEKKWAYAILVFVIIVLCVELRDSRSIAKVLDNNESLSYELQDDAVIRADKLILHQNEDASAEQTVYDADSNIGEAPVFRYQGSRSIKNYIMLAYIPAFVLPLCLISGSYINEYGRCMVSVWQVVHYIHNIDGEKWKLHIFA